MSICYGSKYEVSICYGSKYALIVANTQSNLTLSLSLSLSLSLFLSLSLSNQIDALIYVSDLRVKICGVTGGAPSTLATIIYFQSTAKTA